jgi:ribosome-binding protein aMBF1 (putative translation factor)
MDHPIARWRKAPGISLRALSAATKIPHVRLHHAEHGRALPDLELARIARVLGVEVAALQADSVGVAR